MDVIKSLAFGGSSSMHEIRFKLSPKIGHWQELLLSCIRECTLLLGYELQPRCGDDSTVFRPTFRYLSAKSSTVQYISDIRSLYTILRYNAQLPVRKVLISK
jgi:hypothetical protein